MVVNEGAGLAVDFEGRRFYTLAVGEKGVFRFKLRTRGIAGHGSLPHVGDNALLKLAPLLERLRGQPPREATPDSAAFLAGLLGEDTGDLDAALARIRAGDPPLADLLAEPMLGVTLAPTMAEASGQGERDPFPRRGPGRLPRAAGDGGRSEVRKRIDPVLGEGEYEIEFVETVVGNRSDFGGPLADAVEAWVGRDRPRRRGPAARHARVQRQPLVPQGVRRHRLRLLPPERDELRRGRCRWSTAPMSGSRSPTSS